MRGSLRIVCQMTSNYAQISELHPYFQYLSCIFYHFGLWHNCTLAFEKSIYSISIRKIAWAKSRASGSLANMQILCQVGITNEVWEAKCDWNRFRFQAAKRYEKPWSLKLISHLWSPLRTACGIQLYLMLLKLLFFQVYQLVCFCCCRHKNWIWR